LTEEDIKRAAPYLLDHEYEIIAEVGQGIALPVFSTLFGSSTEKYSVMIKVGELELKTEKAVFAEMSYNLWNFRFK
jgi:hypothetical protein